MYTTCSPHILQKEELLTKIYLYKSLFSLRPCRFCLGKCHQTYIINKIMYLRHFYDLTSKLALKNKIDLLVSFTAKARGFVIFGTIDISTVIESTIAPSNWSTASLVLKMPMKTGERSMLLTLMLQKERTLIHTKLFEIPEKQGKK